MGKVFVMTMGTRLDAVMKRSISKRSLRVP